MNEERFNIKSSAIVDDGTVIIDSKKKYTFPVLDNTLNYMFRKALNEFNDENEELRFLLQNVSDQRDEFHRGARENANRVGKLKKENEQLKQRIKSRLHYYRELYDSTNDDIVKKIVEDLEDILKE